jgi:hypothetical protein
MDELKKSDHRHVDKRHKEEFVSWFEHEVSHLFVLFIVYYATYQFISP